MILRTVLHVLATRRVTGLLIEDEITAPARDRILGSSDNYWLTYLLTCRRCSSVWAAAAVLILSKFKAGSAILDTLALSESVIIIDKAFEYRDQGTFQGEI